jgi:hypothetical protein
MEYLHKPKDVLQTTAGCAIGSAGNLGAQNGANLRHRRGVLSKASNFNLMVFYLILSKKTSLTLLQKGLEPQRTRSTQRISKRLN